VTEGVELGDHEEPEQSNGLRAYIGMRDGATLPTVQSLASECRIPVFTVVAWPIERFGHPELRLFQGDVSPVLDVEMPTTWMMHSARPPRSLHLSGHELREGWHASRPTLRGRASEWRQSRRLHYRSREIRREGISIRVGGFHVTRRELRRFVASLTRVNAE
jgi:hypothetical protein